MLDGEYGAGSTRLRVSGLTKAVRSLERAGADSQDMRDLMHELGTMVVRAANPPQLTGRLANTIRAGRGKTKAVVRAGGARAPYGPIREFGWPDRNIPATSFLRNALQSERTEILTALDRGLEEILRRNDLT